MLTYANPSLRSVLENLKQEVMAKINVMTIGKIVEFYEDRRTADVEIQFLPRGIKVTDTITEYPILYDIPIMAIEYFSAPIKYDDYCLVFFCDRCIDRWFQNNEKAEPATIRTHDLSDGFVLLGTSNLDASTYERPNGYEPPHDLPPVCDCPIPKYGYQPDFARIRNDAGEIDVGWEWSTNSGVIITARDYTNVTMYAEGSDGNPLAGNINMYPTNSVNVNNGQIRFSIHGDSDEAPDPDNKTSGTDNPPWVNVGGKITIANEKLKKTITLEDPEVPEPDNWWLGKEVVLSDMYRIMAQCKALFSLVAEDLQTITTAINAIHQTALTPTLTDAQIMDFKQRYSALFSPLSPLEIGEE